MKKLAFCMVLFALGMVTFVGCKKEDKKPTTPPAVTTPAEEGKEAATEPAATDEAPAATEEAAE